MSIQNFKLQIFLYFLFFFHSISCSSTELKAIGTVEIITIILIIFGVVSVLFMILCIAFCIALIFIIPKLLNSYEEKKSTKM